MKDNFDLKKFLVENKSIENSNPFLKEDARTDAEEEGYLDGMKDEKEDLKSKIREMIINELTTLKHDPESIDDEDLKGGRAGEEQSDMDDIGAESGFLEEAKEDEDEEDYGKPLPSPFKDDPDSPFIDDYNPDITEEGIEEAKEEEEVEEKEEEVTDEEGDEEEEIDVEAEETETETGGGLEDIAADMEGDESDLMDHLISALKVSKGMDNEKLTTQIGNTLKFFVGEYIGGEE
tara:strand:+ start:1890 stop:2591 length:702 start_codon:yes stop_codon:yes gene_type:complete